MTTFFLGIHSGYKEVQIGLFCSDSQQQIDDCHVIDLETIANSQASKQLIAVLDRMLERHAVSSSSLSVSSLAFIFVNQGPAPFTTLRTVLTTVNALHVACGVPLIGIDSLKALAQESELEAHEQHSAHTTIPTITLLDAFNNDVYFCFKDADGQYQTGYENFGVFMNHIISGHVSQIQFIGNGAALHRQVIEEVLGARALFPATMPLTASLPYMAQAALQAWHAQKAEQKLLPLYLKLHPAQMS